MTQTIAFAGKGGVGKTTICGLLIQYLCRKGKGAVLAVDADANSNLNEVLGVEVEMTLGDIRENIARADMADPSPIPANMTKADYAEIMFNNALMEGDDFDMLVMGRTQGKGCYCYVNGILSAQVDKYAKNYRYVVVDNEAGLEHISRGILPKVDTILLVSDCSRRGVQAAGRLNEMIDELNLGAKEVGLIINRAPNGQLNDGVREEIEKFHLRLMGVVPHDDTVYEYDAEGRPKGLFDSLPSSLPPLTKAYRIHSKAARVGFTWQQDEEVEQQVEAEWLEWLDVSAGDDTDAQRHELGDLLFSITELGRRKGIKASEALDDANTRFLRRFARMEELARAQDRDFAALSLDEKDELWTQAKAEETAGKA